MGSSLMLQPTFKGLFLIRLSHVYTGAFHTDLLTEDNFETATAQRAFVFLMKRSYIIIDEYIK